MASNPSTKRSAAFGTKAFFSSLLGALGQIEQVGSPLLVSHYDIMPVIDIYASLQGLDLGTVYDGVQKAVREATKEVPHGALVTIRGQATMMYST